MYACLEYDFILLRKIFLQTLTIMELVLYDIVRNVLDWVEMFMLNAWNLNLTRLGYK